MNKSLHRFIMSVIRALLLAGSACLPAMAAPGWQPIDLGAYSSANFKTVSGVSSTQVYFGGSNTGAGLILQYDGASLTPMTLPVGSLDIRGIARDHAISNGNTVLQRNGNTWESLAITIASPVDLRSISASGGLVVAAGNNGERLRLENGTVTVSPKSSSYRFSDALAADPQHYYVTGADAFTGDPALFFYYYNSASSSWTAATPHFPGAANSFGYVYGIPSGNTMGEVFGVGGHNRILHYVSGSGWSTMTHPLLAGNPDFKFYGLYGDGTSLYAYGHDGFWGTILKYANGAWTNITPEGMGKVYDLWGSGEELYAVAGDQVWRYGEMLPAYQLSLDVIQTIQDPAKFVTGKPIYARVYLTCSNCDPGRTVHSTVQLKVDTATAGISKQMSIDPADTAATLRDQPARSYNFQIPAAAFETQTSVVKNLQVKLEANDGSGVITRELNRSITVEHQDALVVGVVRVRIHNGTQKHVVDDVDLANSERYMKMIYPGRVIFLHLGTADIDVTAMTNLAGENATDGSGNFTPEAKALQKKNGDLRTSEVLSRLARLHLHHVLKQTSGFPVVDYLYGIWPADAPSMPGLSDAYWWPDHFSGYVSHGPPGTAMAHEVGHSLGLGHTVWNDTGTVAGTGQPIFQGHCPKQDAPGEPNPAKADVVMQQVPSWVGYTWGRTNPFIEVYGYEVGLESKVIAKNFFDVMSYCGDGLDVELQSFTLKDTNEWISDIHYNRLVNTLAGVNFPHSISPAPKPGKKLGKIPADKAYYYTPQEVSEYLLVRARIHEDGAVEGLAAESLAGEVTLPRSSIAPTENNYCVETRNVAGAMLDRQCFNLMFRDPYAIPVDSAPIQAGMHPDPAISTVVIMKGGAVLGSLARSANAPVVSSVTLMSATASERRYCWTGDDPDGGSLTYLLEYSPDGGVHWRPVVLDWTDTCYTVDLASLPAANAGKVRIIASDGYNAGIPVEHPAPFVVADAGPEITLTHGRVVCELEAGQQFLLSAWAHDVEDGAIPEEDILWRDSSGQLVGNGEVMITVAEPMAYFTVSASDGSGHTTQAEIILNQPTGVIDDSDCDSMPAAYEHDHGLDTALHDAAGDLDQDLLTNLDEYRIGSDPADADTDGDGRPDGAEVAAGGNPVLNEGAVIQILMNMDD